MTITVKLNTQLEDRLRSHAAACGCTVSEVIRVALKAHLDAQALPRESSALELGADLFGRFHGPRDLSTMRKSVLANLWAEKRRPRS